MKFTKILKYTLSQMPDQLVEIPVGSDILSLQNQAEHVVIWVSVNDVSVTSGITEKRRFRMFVTGETFVMEDGMKYVGTVQLRGGHFVTHIFEVPHYG